MPDVHLEYTLPGAPERVWRAVTDPYELERWFWPSGAETVVDGSFIVGDEYRISANAHYPDVVGRFVVVETARRLMSTWTFDDGDGGMGTETTIESNYEALPEGGTRMILDHRGLPDQASADATHQAWQESIARLREYLGNLRLDTQTE